MIRRLSPMLAGLALAIASPASAGEFRIGTVAFAPADILDARALPQPGATPIIMITFADAALARLEQATTVPNDDADIAITLDGKLLTRIVVRGPRTEPVLTIGGAATMPDAERIAKEISGKDPLPDAAGD